MHVQQARDTGSPAKTDICKLCGSTAVLLFGLPASKLTGHPIPDEADDCWYYGCENCDFCYTRALDLDEHTGIYDENYWSGQDPDWYGRVTESFRLLALGNELRKGHMPELDILDFGCGIGGFVERCHTHYGLNVWGTDIIPPKVGREWFLPSLGDRKFDLIIACEVIEHLPDPRAVLDNIRAHLKPGGVFAFQTAYWDPALLGRDWWYIGPANGHISLFSVKAFDYLFSAMKGRRRKTWGGYPGVQAWQFGRPKATPLGGRLKALASRIKTLAKR